MLSQRTLPPLFFTSRCGPHRASGRAGPFMPPSTTRSSQKIQHTITSKTRSCGACVCVCAYVCGVTSIKILFVVQIIRVLYVKPVCYALLCKEFIFVHIHLCCHTHTFTHSSLCTCRLDKRSNWHIINHAYRNDEYEHCGNSTVSAHWYSTDGKEWHWSPQPYVQLTDSL